ncbi:hypothetical protein HA402_008404 [Bradysia odoriphaga]|nr:hypothetical protein HA402_008404 [Bradysia odoriphaga]
MALTKESAPHHHYTLVVGLIFIFVRISSQQETAINTTVSVMPSTIAIKPIAIVQNISTNSENTTFSALPTQLSVNVTITETPPKSVVTTTASSDSSNSCTDSKRLSDEFQPKYSDQAKLRKCCPRGEIYLPSGGGRDKCDIANVNFVPVVIEAVFFEHCIEDTEKNITLGYDIGNPCGGHEALIYSKDYGDNLYVLQNGSLLRVDNDFSGFDIFDEYCLDMDRDTSVLTAIVCNQTNPSQHLVHVSKAQSYLYAICMLASVPCLLATAYFYLYIPELRNLHGKSLACHSLCLAIGFLMLSIAQINGNISQAIGFVIQYFILSCFFWLAMMCVDICVDVWYFIPQKTVIKPLAYIIRFIIYATISLGIPIILVSCSASKALYGMPSYYLKGHTEATRDSQQYFIPPISTVLFISFVLLVASYFGFRELNPIVLKAFLAKKVMEKRKIANTLETINVKYYEEVKQTARSTAFLYIIMTINWIFEIISFYVHSLDSSLVLFDILNALQGIVIFIIFVCLPKPMAVIKRWWHDRGSLVLHETEMQVLNNGA